MITSNNSQSANTCVAFTPVHVRRSGTRNSGFTLVELLTVMVIIAILFGMIIGIAMYAKRKATEGRAQADIQHMHNAITEYTVMYGKVPPGGGIQATLSAVSQWLPSNVDTNDPWGRPYEYKRLSDRTFDLYSQGYSDTITGDDIRSGN